MRKKRLASFFTAVCLGLLLPGCRREDQPAADEKGARAREAASASVPIARVNGVALSREPFDRELAKILERHQKTGRELTPAARERLKDSLVNGMVEAELVRQRAAKLGVVVSREEEEKEWQANSRRYGSENPVKGAAGSEGMIPDEVRARIDTNLLRGKLLVKVAAGITITPEEIKELYDRNQARFVDPERVRLSEIVIKVQPNATAAEKAQTKKRAETLLRKAKAKNADFAKLARENDEGPAKDRGGDLGFVPRGRMWKALDDAAWRLKVGEVQLVESPASYLVIKKTGQAAARPKTFDEVKDQIERTLRLQKSNEEVRKWRSEAKIEILEKGDENTVAGDRPANPAEPLPTPNPTQAGA